MTSSGINPAIFRLEAKIAVFFSKIACSCTDARFRRRKRDHFAMNIILFIEYQKTNDETLHYEIWNWEIIRQRRGHRHDSPSVFNAELLFRWFWHRTQNIMLPLLISSSLVADLWVKEARPGFVGQALRPYNVMTPVDAVCHNRILGTVRRTGNALDSIREVSVSNLGRNTAQPGYPFFWFSSFLTDKAQDDSSLWHGQCLQNPFQVIFHLSP
jgi:hypothetical protein